MSDNITEGGRAFPDRFGSGMTLRDYMATAVLTGLLAKGNTGSQEGLCSMAYRYADSMLRERTKPQQSL